MLACKQKPIIALKKRTLNKIRAVLSSKSLNSSLDIKMQCSLGSGCKCTCNKILKLFQMPITAIKATKLKINSSVSVLNASQMKYVIAMSKVALSPFLFEGAYC